MGKETQEVQKHVRTIGGVSLAMALLQSLCTAVFAISGLRVAIGLTALAAASTPRRVASIRTPSASPC